MTFTKTQLIDALCAEWDDLCHDDFDPENEPTTEEYREDLMNMNMDQLIEETTTDEVYYKLQEYMERWGN